MIRLWTDWLNIFITWSEFSPLLLTFSSVCIFCSSFSLACPFWRTVSPPSGTRSKDPLLMTLEMPFALRFFFNPFFFGGGGMSGFWFVDCSGSGSASSSSVWSIIPRFLFAVSILTRPYFKAKKNISIKRFAPLESKTKLIRKRRFDGLREDSGGLATVYGKLCNYIDYFGFAWRNLLGDCVSLHNLQCLSPQFRRAIISTSNLWPSLEQQLHSFMWC